VICGLYYCSVRNGLLSVPGTVSVICLTPRLLKFYVNTLDLMQAPCS